MSSTQIDIEDVKRRVCAEVDRLADRLIDASHQIHAHPELNYEEVFAHDLLTDILDDLGHRPERHAYGVGTAFEARSGSSGPDIAVLCEYDALPGIGHACGHNVIATAGLGAGLAAAAFAEELGGRVRIMGTPAEEGGGGKILMGRNGAFQGVDAAMMVHPADADLIRKLAEVINETGLTEIEYAEGDRRIRVARGVATQLCLVYSLVQAVAAAQAGASAQRAGEGGVGSAPWCLPAFGGCA